MHVLYLDCNGPLWLANGFLILNDCLIVNLFATWTVRGYLYNTYHISKMVLETDSLGEVCPSTLCIFSSWNFLIDNCRSQIQMSPLTSNNFNY